MRRQSRHESNIIHAQFRSAAVDRGGSVDRRGTVVHASSAALLATRELDDAHFAASAVVWGRTNPVGSKREALGSHRMRTGSKRSGHGHHSVSSRGSAEDERPGENEGAAEHTKAPGGTPGAFSSGARGGT
uniref:Uncharacterized protein n=1 Tax=Neobacillus citreus TaxID=2833578 RepID=A0A942SXZ9_9BACI